MEKDIRILKFGTRIEGKDDSDDCCDDYYDDKNGDQYRGTRR